jgi:hypothetical protein
MQTRKALKALTKGEVNFPRVSGAGPLADNAKWLLERHAQREADQQASKRRHEVASNLPLMEAAKHKLGEMIGNQAMPDDMPIVTRFDAFTTIKDASRQRRNDTGLRNLSLHLERLWHKEPLGSLSAGAVSRLRDHYQYNHPRSIVAKVVDQCISQVSFNTLPVTKLVRIAADIGSQSDYDHAIVRNHLGADTPECVRARTFIRELVNRKDANISDEHEVPVPVRGDMARRIANRLFKEAKTCSKCGGQECTCPSGKCECKKDKCKCKKAEKTCDKCSASECACSAEKKADEDSEIKSDDMGIDGSGMMQATAFQNEMFDCAASTGLGIPPITKEAKAPEGWEGTVKKMKKEPGIDNPFALAHWMESKGMEPGYTEEGEKKESEKKKAYEWGMEWGGGTPGAMNMAELSRDILEDLAETPDQAMMEMADAVANPMMQDEQVQAVPADQQYSMALSLGLSQGGSAASQLQKYWRDKLMSEPVTAKKKQEGQAEFDPGINQQQPNQLSLEKCQGLDVLTQEKKLRQDRATMKAYAIPFNHPLVDDNCNHFPINTNMRQIRVAQYLHNLEEVPEWWLGSIKELMVDVKVAMNKAAGELPPALEKFKKKPKGEEEKEEPKAEGKSEKGKMPEDVKEKFKGKKSNLTPELIEQALLNDSPIRAAGYIIHTYHGDQGDGVKVASSAGARIYTLTSMDEAIADFLYLASTAKHPAGGSPVPAFFIREGIRLPCPGCTEVNSYEMPTQPSDLACGGCGVVIPARAITAALNTGIAGEETSLGVFVPIEAQEEFGNHFAKAAEMIGADAVGSDGSKAEAYALNVPNEKMAEVWDFMIESGFKPLAQGGSLPPPPATAPPPSPAGGDVMGQGGMPELPGEMPGMAPPVPDIGDPEGPEDKPISQWADHQMIQAALMHYSAQGMNSIEAIAQFNKDYGESYDSETVMQVAAMVYEIDLDEIKISGPEGPEMPMPEVPELGGPGPELGAGPEMPMPMEAGKKKADLPSTSVNQQQPDSVSVPSDLGPDSETQGDISTPGKIKQQVPAQSQSGTSQADQSTEPDSDNKDPDDFGAGKPKIQHPATDQAGVSLPGTDLGQDSERQMGPTIKQMESESAGAYQNVRSK